MERFCCQRYRSSFRIRHRARLYYFLCSAALCGFGGQHRRIGQGRECCHFVVMFLTRRNACSSVFVLSQRRFGRSRPVHAARAGLRYLESLSWPGTRFDLFQLLFNVMTECFHCFFTRVFLNQFSILIQQERRPGSYIMLVAFLSKRNTVY